MKMYDYEAEIKRGNIKLTVFEEFEYEELKKICDAICKLGYSCTISGNGNVVFQKSNSLLDFIEIKDEVSQ